MLAKIWCYTVNRLAWLVFKLHCPTLTFVCKWSLFLCFFQYPNTFHCLYSYSCAHARWTLMHHFLSITWKEITRISLLLSQDLLDFQSPKTNFLQVTSLSCWQMCSLQRQVAFFTCNGQTWVNSLGSECIVLILHMKFRLICWLTCIW